MPPRLIAVAVGNHFLDGQDQPYPTAPSGIEGQLAAVERWIGQRPTNAPRKSVRTRRTWWHRGTTSNPKWHRTHDVCRWVPANDLHRNRGSCCQPV